MSANQLADGSSQLLSVHCIAIAARERGSVSVYGTLIGIRYAKQILFGTREKEQLQRVCHIH